MDCHVATSVSSELSLPPSSPFGVVDERVERAVTEHVAHDLDAAHDVVEVGQVEQDMCALAAPRTYARRRRARDGDHAPAIGVKAQRDRVADAAARAGDDRSSP
jgi:hypothetical protein